MEKEKVRKPESIVGTDGLALEIEKTPILVIGAGLVCTLWLPVVLGMQSVELRGLVDLDDRRARDLLSDFGVSCPVMTDVEIAVRELAPRIVVDLTPPANRHTVAEVAFEGGADIIVEKPLAGSLDEAHELIALALRCNRRLAVMQQCRFHPTWRNWRRILASGELGEPVLLSCEKHHWIPTERLAQAASPVLSDCSVHVFDQARYLLGSRPLRVLARELHPPGSPFSGAAVVICTFEFENDVVFTARESFVAAGLETSWDGAWRLDGTKGAAQWDGWGATVIEQLMDHTTETPTFSRRVIEPFDERSGHSGAIPTVIEQVARGGEIETDARDNIRSLAMVEAAMESSRSGNWVEVPDG